MAEVHGKKFPQYLAAIAATLGALSTGTVLGWSSPAQIGLVDNREYGFTITSNQYSWVGSVITLGAAAISIPIGGVMNRLGRKLTMLLMTIPFIMGWALIVWAQSYAMLLVGRLLVGMCAGSYCILAPIYIGEIAEKSIRGELGSYFQLMITIGILLVYVLGSVVNVFWLSLICGTIPIIFGAIFLLMPETPTYFVQKNQREKAVVSLRWLRGQNYDSCNELQDLKDENEKQSAESTNLMAALKRPASVKALVIGVGLMFFTQMCGINVVIFYTTEIFNAANSGVQAETATIIVGLMQVISTFFATLLMDRLGRRVLLLTSEIVMTLSTIALGAYFFMADRDASSVENITWLPIVSLSLFIVVFSLGFGPIPWLLMGELFASDIKMVAGPAVTTFNWLLAFVVTNTFNNLRNAIGTGETFWLFAGISIIGVAFVYFVVPETKGKSLADIQKMLANEL